MLTRKRKYEGSERRLLRAATHHHIRRLVTAAVVAAILAWIAYDGTGRLRAAGYIRSLSIAETSDVPKLIHDVVPLRRWINPQLKAVYAEGNDKERLHAAMALLPVDASGLDYLLERLLAVDVDSIAPIRKVIFEYGDREVARKELWNVLKEAQQSSSRRLRAAAGLADDYVDGKDRWNSVANDLFIALIDDVNARPGDLDHGFSC